MMEPLTREQVEEQCKNVVYASNGDEGTYAAMNQLQYTDAALRARLTEMTEERDAVLHGGVTEEMLRRQDGTIRLAKGCCIVIESEWDETLRQLTEAQQEIVGLQAKHENLALTLIEQERLYDVLHECIEGKEGWREQRETAVKVMEQQQQEIARLTVVLLRYVRGQQTGSDGVYCSQLMAHEGTKEGAGSVPPPVG